MKKLFATLALATATFGMMTACSAESSANPNEAHLAAAQKAEGFQAGNAVATKTAYVFFDAQCPHCGHLWEAAKPLAKNVRFVWIPVAVLNQTSLTQGASLLAAANPAEAMNQHEASLLRNGPGITTDSKTVATKADAIRSNTRLFFGMKAQSVPYLVFKNSKGEIVSEPGAMDTDELAKKLVVPVPGV